MLSYILIALQSGGRGAERKYRELEVNNLTVYPYQMFSFISCVGFSYSGKK